MEKKETTTKAIIIALVSGLILWAISEGFSFYTNTIKEIATLKAQVENFRVAHNEEIEDLENKINELKK